MLRAERGVATVGQRNLSLAQRTQETLNGLKQEETMNKNLAPESQNLYVISGSNLVALMGLLDEQDMAQILFVFSDVYKLEKIHTITRPFFLMNRPRFDQLVEAYKKIELKLGGDGEFSNAILSINIHQELTIVITKAGFNFDSTVYKQIKEKISSTALARFSSRVLIISS